MHPCHLITCTFSSGKRKDLNKVRVKYCYPLSLVRSATEQMRGANGFTNLELQSTYNLIHHREGDEWKADFIASSHIRIAWWSCQMPMPNSQGHTTMLYLIPLTKQPTSLEITEILFQKVFRIYGHTEGIISDYIVQFTSWEWQTSAEDLISMSVSPQDTILNPREPFNDKREDACISLRS